MCRKCLNTAIKKTKYCKRQVQGSLEKREKPVIKKKQLVSSILTILHTGTLSRRVADAAIKHVVISIRILKSRIVKVCKKQM